MIKYAVLVLRRSYAEKNSNEDSLENNRNA